MQTVTNSVLIRSTPQVVFDSCVDIERWPQIFSGCQEVKKTALSEREVIMDMRVSNELGSNTVRSHRTYSLREHKIAFEMLSVPPDLAAMSGSWSVESTAEGARLVVVHEFEKNERATVPASELAERIHRATERVLGEMKSFLELCPLPVSAAANSTEAQTPGDAYGKRSAANAITTQTFENCELFFARLILCGMDWGDITNALRDLLKANTFEDWSDWHARWTALGARYEERAEAARSLPFNETRRQFLLKAAAATHFAEFMYFDNPEQKRATRARVTALFEEVVPYLDVKVSRITVRHRESRLPGYFFEDGGALRRPCVILINGLDSAKEVELYAFAREFLKRGMSVVAFDGPGQGLLAGEQPMPLDFEAVVGSVLETFSRHPGVDAQRIGIFGVSFGGYLAARAAANHPDSIRACVNLSGGFDHDDYEALNVMVKKDFRFVFGVSEEAAMAQICRQHLNLRNTPRLRAPLLTIHGEEDSIIRFESCLRLMDWACGERELISYPGERHVCTNYFSDYIPRFADWMCQRLEASPDK